MLRGFYQAASGMITQQRRTEMLSDNLANLQTPGHKADHGAIRAFPNLLLQAQNGQSTTGSSTIGTLTTGVYMQERIPDYRQGNIRETGAATDVALMQGVFEPEEATGRPGMLFFAVTDQEGNVTYTRNGNFTIDGEGFLTTSQGNYVLGTEGGPLNVENESFVLQPNGEIFDNTGTLLGQIDVFYAADPHVLVKEGEGRLRLEGAEGLPSANGNEAYPYELQQQFLERSNVDPASTMTNMTNAYRQFEANQTVLQAYDQNLQRTANDVGRLG